MASNRLPLDVEGPVRGEVLVVCERDDQIFLTGPDGPHAWHIETHGKENPMDEIRRTVSDLLPDLQVLHATSWRWERSAVVLTFVAVVGFDSKMAARVVSRAPGDRLARGSATAGPSEIREEQVLDHALRHLAWLAREDSVVREELNLAWHRALAAYVPATFQQIGE